MLLLLNIKHYSTSYTKNVFILCIKICCCCSFADGFLSKGSVANDVAAYISNGYNFFLFDVLQDFKGLIWAFEVGQETMQTKDEEK